MRARVCTCLWLTLLACAADPRPAASTPAGTYALTICRATCASGDGATVLQEGRLFLLDTLLDTTGLSSGARFFLALDGEPPTACWVANAPRNAADTLWPGGRVGGSTWRYDTISGALHVNLWRSVDSHYSVMGYLRGDRFVGRGRRYEASSHGQWRSNGSGWTSDEAVVGRRVGPAEPSPCGPAADTAWARAQTALDTMSSLQR